MTLEVVVVGWAPFNHPEEADPHIAPEIETCISV